MQSENMINLRVNKTPTTTTQKFCNMLITSIMIISIILASWSPQAFSATTLTPDTELDMQELNLQELSISIDEDMQAVAAGAQGPVKWHPGHYMMLVGGGKDSSWYMKQIYTELEAHSALRGLVIRYEWAELEPTKGVYNFASIDHHLAELAKRNKRLIILIETKSFGATEIRVPKYLQTAEYEGGVFAFGHSGSNVIDGYNIKLWNQNVFLRFAALTKALGQHLNAHPYFEGAGLQESALGTPIKPITSTQVNTYYTNLLGINKHFRNNFPNTMSFQYLNFPRTYLSSLVNGLKAMGATLGCPDVFIQDPGLLFPGTKYSPKGIYPYYTELSGAMPLAIQIEKANYLNTKFDGSGYKPTVTELLNFAKQTLKVNYIFWTRSPGYYDDVLAMLRQKAQTSNLSGGLQSACPASYGSCNTN